MNFKTELFRQQQEAVDKLKRLKVGALFMDMGTGKTRTGLSIIDEKMKRGVVDKVLWLCPCSVKENLRLDFEKHLGEQPDFIRIEGIESMSSSDRIYLQTLDYMTDKTMLIVDESSLVKNPRAKRSERIVKLSEKTQYKLILNGTPVSRNEADLYNQFLILDWRILGYKSYYSFAANHLVYKEVKVGAERRRTNQVVRVLNTDYLAERIAPYTYQIKKEEMEGVTMLGKYHSIESFSMTSRQEKLYEEVKWDYLSEVDEFNSTTLYRLFTALQHVSSGRNPGQAGEPMDPTPIFDSWEDNPRILCLDEVLDTHIKGEKVIIFAKFEYEIKEIMALLESKGISYAEFTGRINQKKRDESLRRFAGETQALIANKMCGAFGLNLQHCHNLVFYSNDFNFATKTQAEDRIYRIGQQSDCHIYDIAAGNSMDDMILKNLGSKKSMLAAFREEVAKWKEQRFGYHYSSRRLKNSRFPGKRKLTNFSAESVA